ncbi:hypothetical protein CFC21_067282 [Triticum aestivum]|uniref:KIB1-4 beta-propeller domain-containing protein n=2 Tax=Triticum aestivum TaxID=4565 RepID=A0A3B6KNB5_WHEAT|nr:hypothetical protein CFC21_067282 [Triticum aestivum]
MAMAADWSSLPSNFVRAVADVFLATTDLDYYMTLRSVCHGWRAATADPHGTDPRFHPRRWIMLEETRPDVDQDSRLFLNLDTGRFLRKRLSVLRSYTYLATASGLLVLEEPDMCRLCVLNPFTGTLFRFRVPPVHPFDRSVVVAGSSPMVLFSFYNFHHLAWADQNCVFFPPLVKPTPALRGFTAVVAFQGRVYAAHSSGSVALVELSRRHNKPQITVIVPSSNWQATPTLLVDNAGELLLLRIPVYSRMEVFRVDLVRKTLVPVNSIGNRALFLGLRCSLSVDADRLPAVDANFIYYGEGLMCEAGVCAHRLGDDRSFIERWEDERIIPHTGDMWKPIDPRASRPKSLAHVLVSYCMGKR